MFSILEKVNHVSYDATQDKPDKPCCSKTLDVLSTHSREEIITDSLNQLYVIFLNLYLETLKSYYLLHQNLYFLCVYIALYCI